MKNTSPKWMTNMLHLISPCLSIDRKENGTYLWSSRLHFKGVYRGMRVTEVLGLCFDHQMEQLVVGNYYHLILKEENILIGSSVLQAQIIKINEIDVSEWIIPIM